MTQRKMTPSKMKLGRNPLEKNRRANVTPLLKRNFEELPVQPPVLSTKSFLARVFDMKISVNFSEVFRQVTQKLKAEKV